MDSGKLNIKGNLSGNDYEKLLANDTINAFRIAIGNSISVQNMIDGFVDEFEDETGVDTVNSVNVEYDSTDDFYSLLLANPITVDNMEYATNLLASSAYIATPNSTTALLCHFDGTPEAQASTDASVYSHTLTFNGNAKIVTNKVGAGFIYLNGSSQLSAPDHDDFTLGSGDFTIETWVCLTANPSSGENAPIMTHWDGGGEINDRGWFFGVYNDSGSYRLRFIYCPNEGVSATNVYSTSSYTFLNTWRHLAVVRNGSEIKFYIDGVADATSGDVLGVTIYNSTELLYVGAWVTSGSISSRMTGYLDEIRISNNARYTSNFTASTSAFTSDTNTKLLLHFEGNTNDSGNTGHSITNTSGVLFSTKLNNSSLYLDGSGDYIQIADSSLWSFGTGDFTIEGFFYFRSLSNNIPFVSQYVDGDNRWIFGWQTDNTITFACKSSGSWIIDSTRSWTPSVNTWYHIAVSKSSGTYRFFVNGTQIGNNIDDSDSHPDMGSDLYIGYSPAGPQYFYGLIDDLKISKGVALYTSNFTAPSTELTIDYDLLSFSEDTIKQQGSYALKILGKQTISLNDYVKKTFSPALDLSNQDNLILKVRSNRTGTNLKVDLITDNSSSHEYNITISSANTWETKSLDISSINNADKDNVTDLKFVILNADSETIFYIDEVTTNSNVEGLTLLSNAVEAESEPTEGRLVILEEDIDEITLNTDFKAYISLDSGSNWEEVALSEEGNFSSSIRVLMGNVNMTDRDDKTMKWKITTHNSKNCKIHGIGTFWR